MQNTLIRFKPIFIFFLLGMVILSLSRLGLSLYFHQEISAVNGWLSVFLQGIRVDFASLCLLLALPALLLAVLPSIVLKTRIFKTLITLWLVASVCFLIFLELSTPDFILEYGLRPNRLFVEYLAYPQEVFSMLFKGRPVQSTGILLISAVAAWALIRLATPLVKNSSSAPLGLMSHATVTLVVILVGFAGIRSSTGHRPMNPAMIAFSSNPTVNVLPLNSFYSVAHATRDMLKVGKSASELYGSLSEEEVINQIRLSSHLPDYAFDHPDIPTLAFRQASNQGQDKNIVIILEESLGAQFIGSLGGLPLSPNFDHLSEQGWAFSNLYATGTRSIRGIEAILTGFTPTPNQSVVKQPKSQQDFFTLAETLNEQGYDTTFYYGGEGHFDNMKGFFLSNGFSNVIEQKDYVEPVFEGSWGVSDEDLFTKADEEFKRLHAEGKPFFGFVFSSSNHDPFEFPDDRIELYEQPKNSRNNAAKYADYALGTFFEKAMAAPYWKDTIFLVIADHDSRVFGSDLVPIKHFHIPGLIIGGGIEPQKDDRLVSQIDMAPTLLSIAGIDAHTPLFGRDLSNPTINFIGRAMMQYDKNFAYMEEDQVMVFQPHKPADQFRFDRVEKRLFATELSPELAKKAHAHAIWGSMAYENEWYKD